MLIGWPVTIPAAERDAALPDKLRAEGAGVMNWALDGLADFRISGRLAIPDEARKATTEYRAEQDIVGEWLGEQLVIEDGARAEANEAYRCYCEWCRASGHRPMTKNALTRKLEERGIKRGGDGRRYYLGIHLVDQGSAAQFPGLKRAVGL